MSLRARLTLAAAAAVAIAVLLASVVVFVFVRSQLRGQVDNSLRQGADFFASLPAPPGALGQLTVGTDGEGGIQITQVPALRPATVYVQVVSARGRVMGATGARIPVTSHTAAVAAGTAAPYFSDATIDGLHARVYTSHVGPLDTFPRLAVQVARPLTEVDGTLRRLGWILLGVLVGGIGLAAALGLIVARSALRPVRRLTGAVEEITETRDLARRVELEGSDEVARLATSFNTMLGALEGSLQAQRQLVADASHELRTPLTSIRTNVEVLARADQLPADERDRLVTDLTAQAEELSVLVGDLVELARGNEEVEELEDVRLDELVERAVARASRNAPHVRFEPALEPCVVHGSARRIDRAVRNLLDNAAKWSPAGGVVDVSVSGGVVAVRDNGPGIEGADLPYVFDRFYRSRAARGLPGSGLGLSIVKQVAESHGGSVVAENAPGGGARLTLRLPVVAPDPALDVS
jgi:two-component system sensor histidine kinase MprB